MSMCKKIWLAPELSQISLLGGTFISKVEDATYTT